MKILSFFPILILAGCATQTGVIPTGADTYTILRQGSGFWASPSVLVAEATREAGTYCANKNKTLEITNTREQPVGLRPGAYPEGEIKFRCI